VAWVVTIAVAITVAIAFALAWRRDRAAVAFDLDADRPTPFGYKMAWLAIRTNDTPAVIDALGLRYIRACNWRSGLTAAYDEALAESFLFVSPPVQGWTFVVGLGLPHPLGRTFLDKATPLLLALGGRFPDVQYYFSYPPIDFFAWARVRDGALVRAFATGDEGIVWNKGRPSHEEQALGLRLYELRGVQARRGDTGGALLLHPTEDQVMQVAAGWSLDPTRIDALHGPPGVGFLASTPVGWRPERVRRAAA
jgi:hypothetical protein